MNTLLKWDANPYPRRLIFLEMRKIINNMKFIFMPSYWNLYKPYSKAWDEKLNYLMDVYDFEIIYNGKFAKIGGYEVNVYLHPELSFCHNNYRPSRLTLLRAINKFKKQTEDALHTTAVNEDGVLV